MAITRVTLFKIPEAEHREQLLAMYKTMQKDSLKDGKPYILSVRAGSTFDDQRRQGFTLAVVTDFASEDDMKYYDNECQAHAKLRSVAKSVHQGMMMTYFEPIALA